MSQLPPTHQKIEAIYCGSGTPLILLPGNWLSAESYDSILHKLSDTYRACMPNLFRGSSKPNFTAHFIQDYVRALYEFLEEQHIQKCFLVGTSFGGFIASEFILRHPEKIKKALLVNTLPPKSGLRLPVKNAFKAFATMFWRTNGTKKGLSATYRALKDTLVNCFLKHPLQFIYDGFIAVSTQSPDVVPKEVAIKLLLATQDEFIPLQQIPRSVLISIDHEIIEGDHAWFFVKEELFVEKIKEFCQ